MSLFNFLFGNSSSENSIVDNSPSVNVDGTPMPLGTSSVDIEGKPFGVTNSFEDTSCFDTTSTFDDSFSSMDCSSSFDDSFSSFDDW